jgi:hypothetical protein
VNYGWDFILDYHARIRFSAMGFQQYTTSRVGYKQRMSGGFNNFTGFGWTKQIP